MTRCAAFLLASVALLLGAGCAYQPVASDKSAYRPKPTNTARVLRIEGNSVILGQATARPISTNALLDRFNALMSTGEHAAADDLLARFPDVARQALFDSALARHPSAPAVAAWLDSQASPARGGWAVLVEDRKRNPARYARYDQQRQAIWSAFRKGNFASIAKLDPPTPNIASATEASPWLGVDAAVLTATGSLASGNPEDAAPLFEHAAARAQDWDAAFADRLWLFAALSHRLSDQTSQAEQIEQQMSSLNPSGLSNINDPMALRLALKTVGRNPALAPPDVASDRMIHARLGEIELQRGAPQAALLSFRAAEAKLGIAPSTDQLRLKQAEALIALKQEQPAIVTLTGLAKGKKTRPQALAMLGLIYLKRNEVETSMSMLRETIRLTTPQSHPDIHTDAGLALLSVGQREEGLRLLRTARQAYKQQGDYLAVHQSLNNELRYAESEGDTELAQQVRRELGASRLYR